MYNCYKCKYPQTLEKCPNGEQTNQETLSGSMVNLILSAAHLINVSFVQEMTLKCDTAFISTLK